MARRPETYSIYVGVSPIGGVVVNYDRLDQECPGRWLMISTWLVPGTFVI